MPWVYMLTSVVDENPELLAEMVDPKDSEQTKPRASKSAHRDTKPKDSVALRLPEAEHGPPPLRPKRLPCRNRDIFRKRCGALPSCQSG